MHTICATNTVLSYIIQLWISCSTVKVYLGLWNQLNRLTFTLCHFLCSFMGFLGLLWWLLFSS